MSWTIVDQVAFSGAGLLLNLILIRALPGDGYGRYSLAFAVFLILSGAHNSFVLEPISVLGSSVDPEVHDAYFGNLLVLHFGVSLAISTVAAAVIAVIPIDELRSSFVAMVLALPFILLIWTVRRLCYISSNARVAAIGSLCYFAALSGAVLLVTWLGTLSPTTAFCILGVAALPATIVILILLPEPVHVRWGTTGRGSLGLLAREHWGLGKWVSLQTLFSVLSSQLGILFAGAAMGVMAAGVLRALSYVILPVQQIMIALAGSLALPVLARTIGQGDEARARSLTTQVTVGITALAVGNLVLLLIFLGPISKFLGLAGQLPSEWLIVLTGLGPVCAGLAGGAVIALRASRRVLYYPVSTAVTGLSAAALTPLLVLNWGVTGAVVSGVAVSAIAATVNIALYRSGK